MTGRAVTAPTRLRAGMDLLASDAWPHVADPSLGFAKGTLPMIRSYRSVAFRFVASFLLMSAAAWAQGAPIESNHLISVGLGGGVSVPVSDAKDAFKTGFNGQGFAKLNLHML